MHRVLLSAFVLLLLLLSPLPSVSQSRSHDLPPDIAFVAIANCQVTHQALGWYGTARVEYANPEMHNGGKSWEKVIVITHSSEKAAAECGKWIDTLDRERKKEMAEADAREKGKVRKKKK